MTGIDERVPIELCVSGCGHVGLISCESVVGWSFLTPVERELLRSVLLDIDHSGALRMPTGVQGAVSMDELSALSDDALIARFNGYVDLLLGADWLLCIYDVCRPEVRALLSDAPMRDARYWRMRHGTPMADADVERAARALLHAGLHKPLGEACARLDETVERMLVRVVLGERCDCGSEIMSAGVRVLRESWADLVFSFPVVERVFLTEQLEDIALAVASALLLSREGEAWR